MFAVFAVVAVLAITTRPATAADLSAPALSTASGPPGTAVTVTSTQACPAGTTSVNVWNSASPGSDSGSFFADAELAGDGTWTARGEVLNGAGDVMYLRGQCFGGSDWVLVTESVQFTVTLEEPALDPWSGPVGTYVMVRSNTPCPEDTTTAELAVFTEDLAYTSYSPVSMDGDRMWTADFTVPTDADLEAGMTLTVAGRCQTPDRGTISSQSIFTVTAAPVSGTLEFAPMSGLPGSSLGVSSVTPCPANSTTRAVIELRDSANEVLDSVWATADNAGNWSARLAVPAAAEAGPAFVRGWCENAHTGVTSIRYTPRTFTIVAAPIPPTPTPPPPPAAPTPATCSGFRATIVGTDGPDTLVGTSGRDVIAGLDGADMIKGLGGNDIICGGDGADKLKGGRGDDWLSGGGSGFDRCNGGAGRDWAAEGCERRRNLP